MKRLMTVVPVALLITLILLFKSFNSLPLAVLTLLNVPFALMGGVFGLYLARMPLSVAAAVGFIALIGQAALNGVLVVSAIHERISHGESIDTAIPRGCRERLRPVLMTALLAALGLVPAALSRAMGAETQRPIAVVIVTGTLSACVLTLIVLPSVYSLWSRRAPAPLALDDVE
jgi:heavy metal efflux system protein